MLARFNVLMFSCLAFVFAALAVMAWFTDTVERAMLCFATSLLLSIAADVIELRISMRRNGNED